MNISERIELIKAQCEALKGIKDAGLISGSPVYGLDNSVKKIAENIAKLGDVELKAIPLGETNGL